MSDYCHGNVILAFSSRLQVASQSYFSPISHISLCDWLRGLTQPRRIVTHHTLFSCALEIFLLTYLLGRWAWTSKSKKKVKIDTGVTISHIRGHAPAEPTITKFDMRGRVVTRRCNHLCQILLKSVKGFRSCEGPNMGSSIDFDSRPYNRSALPCCLLWALWLSAAAIVVFSLAPSVTDLCLCYKIFYYLLTWWRHDVYVSLELRPVVTTIINVDWFRCCSTLCTGTM